MDGNLFVENITWGQPNYSTGISKVWIRLDTLYETSTHTNVDMYPNTSLNINLPNTTNASSNSSGGFESQIIIPLYVVIFLLSVIGNSLVLITLVQNKRMRTVTNVYLLNLALSDLLLGVFCMPFTLVGQVLKNFIFGALMCKLIPYFQAIFLDINKAFGTVWHKGLLYKMHGLGLPRYILNMTNDLRKGHYRKLAPKDGLEIRAETASET